MMRSKPIQGELLKLKDRVRALAVDYGLDFFEVIFEMCDYDTVNILAAQGGFPSRYPHWKFGMEYDQLSKSYSYGLSKIYEMVINTDPCYAYLLSSNHFVDQKIVMAHVYAHSDFFKNNYWFSQTNRKMMDVMANHGTKIRRYMDKFGHEKVEKFIDQVLSIENLVDAKYLFETPELERKRQALQEKYKEELEQQSESGVSKALQSYMRDLERVRKKDLIEDVEKEDDIIKAQYQLPEKDIMKFLMEHAPLHEWQADVLGILREETYYFLPQGMTKIMNEGWASYWHEKIMCEKLVSAEEIVDFADKHAGVLAMQRNQLNPYKLGIELMKDIEYRWNTGRFGKEYNECNDIHAKENWDTKAMRGREKIFEVRKSFNDITFIDEFLTEEFCNRQQLFTYKYNPRTGRNEIDTRDFQAIKQKILLGLTNFGAPQIQIVDANYNNRGELLLSHLHTGADLDMSYAQETMRNIQVIWKRPVNLATTYDDKEVVIYYNGKEFTTKS
jgi:stage V sporulation protein R